MSAFNETALAEMRKARDMAKTKLAVAMDEIKPLHDEVMAIEAAIGKALEHQARNAFQAAGKIAGDITLTTEAGKVKASISKSVKWDTSKLQAIASSMSWAEARGVFKIDFSVPEANYKAAQTMRPELAAKLLDAREVKYGDLKLDIIE